MPARPSLGLKQRATSMSLSATTRFGLRWCGDLGLIQIDPPRSRPRLASRPAGRPRAQPYTSLSATTVTEGRSRGEWANEGRSGAAMVHLTSYSTVVVQEMSSEVRVLTAFVSISGNLKYPRLRSSSSCSAQPATRATRTEYYSG